MTRPPMGWDWAGGRVVNELAVSGGVKGRFAPLTQWVEDRTPPNRDGDWPETVWLSPQAIDEPAALCGCTTGELHAEIMRLTLTPQLRARGGASSTSRRSPRAGRAVLGRCGRRGRAYDAQASAKGDGCGGPGRGAVRAGPGGRRC
jgi:hypothetical protein